MVDEFDAVIQSRDKEQIRLFSVRAVEVVTGGGGLDDEGDCDGKVLRLESGTITITAIQREISKTSATAAVCIVW